MEFVKFSQVVIGLLVVGSFAFANEQLVFSQEQIDVFERSCEGGEVFYCGALGDMYNSGLAGVNKDIKKAIKFYKKACDANMYEPCSNLGSIYAKGDNVKKDNKKAIELYNKACDGKYALGCANLGNMYYEGRGVKINRTKGATYFRKACNAGNWLGCGNFGIYNYNDTRNIKKAKEYFKKPCDLGADAQDVRDILRNKEVWQKYCDIYEAL